MTNNFGKRIAEARKEQQKTLRGLAEEVGVSPSYLNDIEFGRRTPAPDKIADLARALGLDADELLTAAGRVGTDDVQYLRSTPSAAMLMRKVSGAGLSDDDLKKLIQAADLIIDKRDAEP